MASGQHTDEPDDAEAPTERPGYVREPQHGPEMDDTQVEATGELADELDPVTEEDGED
jgi:hypothetical protein